VLTRVAVATSQDVATILRAPYYRTLWTFYHLQQHDRVADLLDRGRALHQASLTGMAMNKPSLLSDEHRKLLAEAGQLPTAEASIESAGWIVDAVATLDAHEAKQDAPGATEGGAS
jgi:hypothetical protein